MGKHEEAREQRKTIVKILYKIGISKNIISKKIGINPITLNKDLLILGLTDLPVKTKEESFQSALKLYARIKSKYPHSSFPVTESNELDQEIAEILEEYLNVGKIITDFLDFDIISELICTPEGHKEEAGHIRLINEIFPLTNSKSVWKKVLNEFSECNEGFLPKNRDEVKRFFCKTWGYLLRYNVGYIWPDDESYVKEKISKLLKTLTEQEALVVIMKLGINTPEQTLSEIGKKFEVGKERIRQIYNKAIRKLKHPTRSKKVLGISKLNPSFDPVLHEAKISKRTDQNFKELEEHNKLLVERLILLEETMKYKIVFEPIEEHIDFSARTRKCLKKTEIELIGDLAELTTNSLLQIKNLGKKSVKEISDKLEQIGLSIGMDLPFFNDPEIRDLFIKE